MLNEGKNCLGEPVKRWLVIPDAHVPFHDRAAWSCVLQAIKMVKPDGFINLGDFTEGESVAHWQWKKKKRPPLDYQLKDIDAEIGIVNGFWDDLDAVLDKCKVKERVYIMGNHDDWWDRMVEENPFLEFTRHDYGSGYLFKDAFRLSKRGYHVVPIGDHYQIGKLYFSHGEHCRSALLSSRWHCLHGGVNMIYGHFHDVQEYSISHLDGNKGAWCIGCLKSFKHEDANQWLIRRSINWSHAFAVVDFWTGGLFTVHTVRIIDGRCSLWGNLIDGRKK